MLGELTETELPQGCEGRARLELLKLHPHFLQGTAPYGRSHRVNTTNPYQPPMKTPQRPWYSTTVNRGSHTHHLRHPMPESTLLLPPPNDSLPNWTPQTPPPN